MESRPVRRGAPRGALTAPWLLGLLLSPWTLLLTGGQSVTHTGLPIMVTLAKKAVSFNCSITYPYTEKYKNFVVSYFYVDRQGQKREGQKTSCQPRMGTENQTLTTKCKISPKLPDTSATGTYYCSVKWSSQSTMNGNGTFILVREADEGFTETPSPEGRISSCGSGPGSKPGQTGAASGRIPLHGPAAPGDRGLRLHAARDQQTALRQEPSPQGKST
ncbi:NFAT activation molecule 1 isoform X2 [Pteronotus mesoamericanus]|uniref:NFAT activation molecule 1 isoform X2 n=1 Tax=Pteronotus mesoamericanus TaxID=1884717 RepID=UPI0023EC233A|nr:NFAT activation molecule 1 isoform X2 [Pteronotus parnellii mesoamericanus]